MSLGPILIGLSAALIGYQFGLAGLWCLFLVWMGCMLPLFISCYLLPKSWIVESTILWIVVGFFSLSGVIFYAYNNKKDDVPIQRTSEDLLAFARSRAPILNDSLSTVRQIRAEITEKRSKLVQVLKSLGKLPEADIDVVKYTSLLKEIDIAEQNLLNNLTETYLAYKKFEISSDPSYSNELNRLSVLSKEASDEIQQKYRELRQSASSVINTH